MMKLYAEYFMRYLWEEKDRAAPIPSHSHTHNLNLTYRGARSIVFKAHTPCHNPSTCVTWPVTGFRRFGYLTKKYVQGKDPWGVSYCYVPTCIL